MGLESFPFLSLISNPLFSNFFFSTFFQSSTSTPFGFKYYFQKKMFVSCEFLQILLPLSLPISVLTLRESLHPFVQNLVFLIPPPWLLPKLFDVIQCFHFLLVPWLSFLSACKYTQGFPISKAKSKQWATVYVPFLSPSISQLWFSDEDTLSFLHTQICWVLYLHRFPFLNK